MQDQGAAVIPVMEGAEVAAAAGECRGLTFSSGSGKPTLMGMIWGNYLAALGSIMIGGVDVAKAALRQIIARRRGKLGSVSQFPRVVPKVPTLDVVAEPLLTLRVPEEEARTRADNLLAQLNISEGLWVLAPTTFSGSEQQRVNIARGHPCPALFQDEPTASLNAVNREVVLALTEAATARCAAIIVIFRDEAVRARLCDRLVDVTRFTPGAA